MKVEATVTVTADRPLTDVFRDNINRAVATFLEAFLTMPVTWVVGLTPDGPKIAVMTPQQDLSEWGDKVADLFATAIDVALPDMPELRAPEKKEAVEEPVPAGEEHETE